MSDKYKLLMTVDEMSKENERWLDLRKSGIGGSDVAAIMGLSKWKTAIEVWLEKTGEPIDDDIDEGRKERFHFGHVLEQVVADEFESRTQLKLRKQGMIRSSEYEWAIADVDRMIVGKPWLLECKTADSWVEEEYEGDNIPVAYYLQIQWYLWITGCEKAFIAILFGGNHFIYKEVPRNDDDIKGMVETCKNFWEQYVVTKTPPPADASDAYSHYLSQHTQHLNEESIVMDPMMELKVKDVLAMEEQIRMLEEQVALKKNQLRADMINYTSATSERYRVSYKTIERYDIDKKRFMAEYPELYEKLKKRLIYRSLRVSGHNSRPKRKYKD